MAARERERESDGVKIEDGVREEEREGGSD